MSFKKTITAFLVVLFYSCSTQSNVNTTKPLYEVLTQQSDGGASIRFFEVLTESKEIKMLESDENLKKKINSEDIVKSNFVILNMGEKPTGGYLIGIENVEETSDNIIITVKDENPKTQTVTAQVFSNPYTIVKINSKKEIIFK